MAAHVGVIDIGKSNAKVALVDVDAMREIGVLTVPNRVVRDGPYPHYDSEGLWAFVLDGLAQLHRRHGIDAVTATTHGAAAALLDAEGGLAAPVLDYEHDGPDALAEAYDAVRPDFAETGSPRLPMGLNLGAQLFWQLETQRGLRARLAQVVTYPQYWSGRLTGVIVNEMTSLGCHTDLWNPTDRRFSSLVERLGLGERMAPVRGAAEGWGRSCPRSRRGPGSMRRRRSIAESTIPMPRSIRIWWGVRRRSRWCRPGPGWSRWRSADGRWARSGAGHADQRQRLR